MASKKRRKITPEDIREFRLVSDPQISPNGETVVFVHKRADKPNTFRTELWTVPSAGGAARSFTSSGKDAKPRWSPDGKRIAFVSSGRAESAQLFTISVDGGEATQLTRFPEGQIAAYAWAPDGTKLAVTFREQDPDWTKAAAEKREADGESDPPRVLDDLLYRLDGDGYFNAQRHALYVVDAETGDHRKVFAKDTLGYFSFDWSPDSRELVVAANIHRRALLEPFRTELFRVDVRTGKPSKVPDLPQGPKASPCWSPDGKQIAYAGRVGKDDIYSVENLELFVCDARSGKAKSLTKDQDYCLLAIGLDDLAEVEFAPRLQWARDGKRIFCSIGHEGRMHTCAVPARGGKLEFLSSGPGNCFMGNQSRDGLRMAAMLGNPTTPPEIAVARVDADYAECYRDFAATARTHLPPERADAPIWFVGHWGWLHYAERAGFRQLHVRGPQPEAGDILIEPVYVDKGSVLARVPQLTSRLHKLDQVVYSEPLPVRTLHPTGAHFYALFTKQGRVPYRFQSGVPLEVFEIYEVR